jgi:hypothetical protein
MVKAKAKATSTSSTVKKVNPWMAFLKKFRESHPEIKDPIEAAKKASVAYKKR